MHTKIIVTLSFAFFIGTVSYAAVAPEKEASLKATFSSIPLSFTENRGQWPDSILYRATAGGATMWFTPTGAYYQFTRRIPRTEDFHQKIDGNPPERWATHPVDKLDAQSDSTEISMIKSEFVGANLNPSAEGVLLMEYKCNYFIGNEPDKWRTDVPNYESIQYQDVYPGIDLKYYGNGKQMEYDFIVSPGSDYRQIQIRYDGAESLSIGENGELIIKIVNGEIIEKSPVIHQIIDGHKVELEGQFLVREENTFSFEVDNRYNPAHSLVIDPVLIYSTYLGGSGIDEGYGITVDAAGAAYLTGFTNSTIFPTLNPYQTGQGLADVFVTKLSSAGSSLVYSTYLGGDSLDYGYAIAVDTSGAAYVTGLTRSTDFPTLNPYQTDQGGDDAFVTKLSGAGSSLIYSTYLGGNSIDYGYGIAVDAVGSAYVTGYTVSTNFPTLNPYQTHQGADDAFVTKISQDGDNLNYSTYLGGGGTDYGYAIAVDTSGAAYVTGPTESTNFPTLNPYQTDQAGPDAYVTKFFRDGNTLVYSTYLGGSDYEEGLGIAVDASGAAYVTGSTGSTNFPTLNPYQTDQVGTDAFVTKLSQDGDNLNYSTYLGGGGADYGDGIAVDAAGVAYVTGYTLSTNFPTLNPYQSTNQGILDAFVTKLSSAGSSLVYSTYLGGSSIDYGYGIVVDASGEAYVSGQTSSTLFPTLNPYQTDQGNQDAFVTKFYCCVGIRGDVNGDGAESTILDLNYMVNDIFRGGPASLCPQEADLNIDGTPSTILDLNFIVNDIFRGGPAPAVCF